MERSRRARLRRQQPSVKYCALAQWRQWPLLIDRRALFALFTGEIMTVPHPFNIATRSGRIF